MLAAVALVALGGCSKGGDDGTPSPQYTITTMNYGGGTAEMVSKAGGHMTIELGTNTLFVAKAGTKLLLTAQAEEAYVFRGWQMRKISGTDWTMEYSMDNPWELTMPATDVEFQANFVRYKANGYVSYDQALISQLRNDAVDTLIIGAHSFVLEASLSRDFMPMLVDPEDAEYFQHTRGMAGANQLIEINKAKIPENIEPEKQYVIHGDSVWAADYEQNVYYPSLPEYTLLRISRNGPKWEPRVYVDVIAQVFDSKTQKRYYIKHDNVFFQRLD